MNKLLPTIPEIQERWHGSLQACVRHFSLKIWNRTYLVGEAVAPRKGTAVQARGRRLGTTWSAVRAAFSPRPREGGSFVRRVAVVLGVMALLDSKSYFFPRSSQLEGGRSSNHFNIEQ